MKPIENIARGIIFENQKLLVVRSKKKQGFGHAFLPGGHIEPGESAKVCLAREMAEESGVEGLEVGLFLATHENIYGEGEGRTHEINQIFECALPRGVEPKKVVSREKHIAFAWVSLGELDAVNLQPQSLRKFIAEWVRTRSSFGQGVFLSEM